MNNPFLTSEQIKEVFRKCQLEEQHNFLAADLQALADAFCYAVAPIAARIERVHCIEFVRSLNVHVADALEEKRGLM
jgi:hypothetical protein